MNDDAIKTVRVKDANGDTYEFKAQLPGTTVDEDDETITAFTVRPLETPRKVNT